MPLFKNPFKNWKKLFIRKRKDEEQREMMFPQETQANSIFQLPSELLGQIINKLECKSFFRMQRTCRHMADFIRTNRNIKFILPREYILEIFPSKKNKKTRYYLDVDGEDSHRRRLYEPFDFESLHGVRFYQITFFAFRERALEANFPTRCTDKFQKYRITANIIMIDYISNFSKEALGEFLKVVKPQDIWLQSCWSNLYEVLLSVKGVKEVMLKIGLDDMKGDAVNIIKSFMGKFEKLVIGVAEDDMYLHFDIAKAILQHLREPYPNLQFFTYRGYYDRDPGCIPIPPVEEALQELVALFQDFNPVLDKTKNCYWPYKFNCNIGKPDHTCKFRIREYFMEVHFEMSRASSPGELETSPPTTSSS